MKSQLELHQQFLTARRIKALMGLMWLFLIWPMATPASGQTRQFRVFPTRLYFMLRVNFSRVMKPSVACQNFSS